jgi:hypothetical protein
VADEDVTATDETQASGDEGGAVEATVEATEAPAASAEDWRASLEEDMAKRAQKFASPADLAKSYFELESRLGKSVVLPGKNASEEEIAAFRKRLGVPDSADGYTLPLPEEVVSDEGAMARLNAFREKMHKAGATPASVQAAYETYQEMVSAASEERTAAMEAAREKAEADLRKEWRGQEFDRNVSYAQRALQSFDGDKTFQSWVESAEVDGIKVGNHPQFLKLFAKIGRTMSEDSVHLAPSEDEVLSLNEQVSKLRDDKREAMKRGDRATAQRLDEQERQLYARLDGSAPIVGKSQRVA